MRIHSSLARRNKSKNKKLILVAPWKIPEKEEQEEIEFYTYEINESIKSNIKEIIIFTSTNEEEDGKKSAQIFHKALGGKLIELKNKGHYIQGDMGTTKFPELLEEILK
ncbi:MAG: alpha/beta hydrolase [Nanoarchaeota archaeon]|nr:alpha/beta hydrolase [Nanoarchaeota archaeon]